MNRRHPIRIAARRTGLTVHAIRAWEKRYGAVTPLRTSTNQRLYSDDDIHRLLLLRRATGAGHGIGQIARLPVGQLLALAETNDCGDGADKGTSGTSLAAHAPESHIEACLGAVVRLDAGALENALAAANADFSQLKLLEEVLAPLLVRVGGLWRLGALRVAHEHFATTSIRTFLGNLRRAIDFPPEASSLVSTTPAGQLHELGALFVAATATAEGWRVAALGADLPAEEIASAVRQTGAKAVALSIAYPPSDPRLSQELTRLRGLLPEDVAMLVGGRAAQSYEEILHEIGAVRISDIAGLPAVLDLLRLQGSHR